MPGNHEISSVIVRNRRVFLLVAGRAADFEIGTDLTAIAPVSLGKNFADSVAVIGPGDCEKAIIGRDCEWPRIVCGTIERAGWAISCFDKNSETIKIRVFAFISTVSYSAW